MQDLISLIKNNKRILITGPDSSGKTELIKSIVKELSNNNSILIFSNHREIKQAANNPDNVTSFYKPRNHNVMELKFLKPSYNIKIVDEICDNYHEVLTKTKYNTIIIARTMENNDTSIFKDFDLVIKSSKDKENNVSAEIVYTKK